MSQSFTDFLQNPELFVVIERDGELFIERKQDSVQPE